VAYAKAGSSGPPEMADELMPSIRAYLWNMVDSVEVKATKKDIVFKSGFSLFLFRVLLR
jgi:hypothetical protein